MSEYDSGSVENELKSLMMESIKGNDSSYEAFLSLSGTQLRKFICKINKGQEREDIVQETLIAIHLKRHTYDPKYPIIPWIFQIAKYKNIDFWRKNKIATEVYFDNKEAAVMVSSREQNEIFDQITEGLNETQKKIISLAKVEGYSIEEISKKLNISAGSVKVMIHRCMKFLKERRK